MDFSEALTKLRLTFKRNPTAVAPSFIAVLLKAYGHLLRACVKVPNIKFKDVTWSRGELLKLFSPCSFIAEFAWHERGLQSLATNKQQVPGLSLPSLSETLSNYMSAIFSVLDISKAVASLQSSNPDINALQATAWKPESLYRMVINGTFPVLEQSILGKVESMCLIFLL